MKEPIKMNIKQVKAQILLECPTCGSMKYVWVDVVDGIVPPISEEEMFCDHYPNSQMYPKLKGMDGIYEDIYDDEE